NVLREALVVAEQSLQWQTAGRPPGAVQFPITHDLIQPARAGTWEPFAFPERQVPVVVEAEDAVNVVGRDGVFQLAIAAEQLRKAGAPVLNVVVAELAVTRGVVERLHPGVIDVELESAGKALHEVKLERIVAGIVTLAERIPDAAHGGNAAEQIL